MTERCTNAFTFQLLQSEFDILNKRLLHYWDKKLNISFHSHLNTSLNTMANIKKDKKIESFF